MEKDHPRSRKEFGYQGKMQSGQYCKLDCKEKRRVEWTYWENGGEHDDENLSGQEAIEGWVGPEDGKKAFIWFNGETVDIYSENNLSLIHI